jgi:hypothetical protein
MTLYLLRSMSDVVIIDINNFFSFSIQFEKCQRLYRSWEFLEFPQRSQKLIDLGNKSRSELAFQSAEKKEKERNPMMQYQDWKGDPLCIWNIIFPFQPNSNLTCAISHYTYGLISKDDTLIFLLFEVRPPSIGGFFDQSMHHWKIHVEKANSPVSHLEYSKTL